MLVVDIDTCDLFNEPDHYMQCSVCLKWREPGEFSNAEPSVLKNLGRKKTRTNCTTCYEMPFDEMTKLKKFAEEKRDSWNYRQAVSGAKRDAALMSGSMAVSELTELLDRMPADSRVYIAQEGYYCEGEVADFHSAVDIRNSGRLVGDKWIYELGISSQHP